MGNPDAELESNNSSVNVNSVLFTLFRYKWKVILVHRRGPPCGGGHVVSFSAGLRIAG